MKRINPIRLDIPFNTFLTENYDGAAKYWDPYMTSGAYNVLLTKF